MKKTVLLLVVVMTATMATAQDVIVKRDTIRDTIVIREVVREYVIRDSNGTIKDVAKPEKKLQPISIRFDMRGEWVSHFDARTKEQLELAGADGYNSAFAGKYLQIYLDGNITDGLSYHYRQRLNRVNDINDIFKSIDKACMRYDFKSGWNIQAGKFPLAFGGWEYDAAPIDVYFSTEFWNQIYCFQFGLRGGYDFKDGHNSLVAEVANSPFNPVFTDAHNIFNSMYCFSLLWYGSYEHFQSSYSINAYEVKNGVYMGQLLLGNRFLAGPMTIEFDYQGRYYNTQHFFEDFSLSAKVVGNIHDWVHVFAQGDLDYNTAHDFTDMPETTPYWVQYGDKILTYGAGVEVFPIKKNKLFRLHAFWCQSINFRDGNDWRGVDLKKSTLDIGMTLSLTAFERK